MVNVAFIGVGDIAVLHADAVRKLTRHRLVGVWNFKRHDLSAGGHEIDVDERARTFGADKVYDTVEDLLGDPQVEVVYVLTPLESHYEYVVKVLQAGKHCLVEKPVGVSLQQIRHMKHLAKQYGRICMPGHNYVYEPQLERIRDMIVNGALGKLAHIHIYYNIYHGPAVTGKLPGIIKQIMTHHAYTLLYLTRGEAPSLISAMKATVNDPNEQENIATVMMQTPSGISCFLQASFANDDHTSDPWSFYIKVLGTNGGARYSYNDFISNQRDVIHSHTYGSFHYTIQNLNAHLLDRCVANEEPPLSTLDHAETAFQILQAVERSIQEQRHVVLED